MTIEIWSDIMCPFCYIGKHNFEEALHKMDFKENVKIDWKSFQLDTALDTVGMTTSAYLSEKKGMSDDAIIASVGNLVKSGLEKGITFNFDKSIAVNTRSAHKLLQLAKENGKGSEAEELLFKAHFTDGENVAESDVLVEIGIALGLENDSVVEALQSSEYGNKVDSDLYEASQVGVRGVPFFVFDRKYAVSGAQPVEVFEEVLNKAYHELSQQ